MPKLSQGASAVLAEFIGTFLFTLTIPLATAGVGSMSPVPIGFMYAAMVFCFGYISGGHLNPAISFAALMSGKMRPFKFLCYCIAHTSAALLASFYAAIIIGVDFATPQALTLLTVWRTLLTEGVYSFALASVVLNCTYSRQKDNNFYGFAIGMTVLASAFAVDGFDNGAFNPAVATGVQLGRCMLAGHCEPLMMLWVFWAAPMGGSFLGAMFFNILDTQDKNGKPQEDAVHRLADFH